MDLAGHLRQAMQDSTKLLHLEQQIKQAVGHNHDYSPLLELARIVVSEDAGDQALRYIAALVLKNTVKNFVADLVASTEASETLVQ